MGYLYAITRDAELAEEVYQNAAVVIIEKASSDKAIRNFRAWAKEVVRRQALHAIRSVKLLDVTGEPSHRSCLKPSRKHFARMNPLPQSCKKKQRRCKSA